MDIKITYNLSYNGISYTDHPNAAYDHALTTLGNLNNEALAVSTQYYHLETEVFNINSNTWSRQTPFPYCSDA